MTFSLYTLYCSLSAAGNTAPSVNETNTSALWLRYNSEPYRNDLQQMDMV